MITTKNLRQLDTVVCGSSVQEVAVMRERTVAFRRLSAEIENTFI